MKKTKQIEFLLTVVFVFCIIAGLTGCTENNRTGRSHAEAQPIIREVSVQSSVSANSITARGTVESVQRRNVYTTLGLMIDRIYVKVGDRVTEGQVLGEMDAADLTHEVNIAAASLRMAEINLAMAEHDYRILQELYDSRAIARNDLQQADFTLQTAAASRNQAQAMLDAARSALARSIIRSPINGTVTAVIAREGEVGMGRMFVIEDTDNLKITTNFRQYDLESIKPGMEVIISSDATGDAEYTGIISRINPTARADAGIIEFEAEVLVTSPNTGLRIGTNARLNILKGDITWKQ